MHSYISDDPKNLGPAASSYIEARNGLHGRAGGPRF